MAKKALDEKKAAEASEATYRRRTYGLPKRQDIEPIKFQHAHMVGLKLGAGYRLADKIAISGPNSDLVRKTNFLTLYAKASAEFRDLLVSQGVVAPSHDRLYDCPPWSAEMHGRYRSCFKHHTCPFCFAKRLAIQTIRLANSAGILNQRRPLDYDLVAITHYDYWDAQLSDHELQKCLTWELSQRSYMLKQLPHYGAIWSTTLQPPLRDGREGPGEARHSIRVRTAALLLVPSDTEMPQRRKWPYTTHRAFAAGPGTVYQYASRTFRFPRRLLFNRDPADAVRVVRLQHNRKLHYNCPPKLSVVSVNNPLSYPEARKAGMSEVTNAVELTPNEFLQLFDGEVRDKIREQAVKTEAKHVVCFTRLDSTNSYAGEKTAVMVGPPGTCTFTLDAALETRLGDVPSRHRYPTEYCRVPSEWND